MKKESILYKALFTCLMISALFLTSCANLFNDTLKEKATVYISLDGSDGRAVLPTYDFTSFKDFTLTGKKGSDAEKTLGSWSTYSELQKASFRIDTGKWTFTLSAKYGAEEFSGTASADIAEGKQVTLNFVLTHGSSVTKGSVDLNIKYYLNSNITKVSYTLGKLDATSYEVQESITGDKVDDRIIIIKKDNLSAGKYLLECNFYSGENGTEKLGSYDEIIVVEAGLKTEFDYEIPYLLRSIKNNKVAQSKSENLDYIFNNTTLGTTTITIKRSEWNNLCNNYRYFYKNENCVHAESYMYEKDGALWKLEDVGFRLRGNTSRYCPQGWDNGKEQGQANAEWGDYYTYGGQPNNNYRQSHFKVDFEEFLWSDANGKEVEQKMAGCLKGVALKRMDTACGKEVFCYDLFRKNGIWTAPRACQTRVIIKIIEDEGDGSTTTVDYGVYEMFEEVNKQSLKARAQENNENKSSNAWKNSKGNLWKCSNDLTGKNLDKDMGVEDIRIFYEGETITGNKTVTKTDEFGGNRIGYVWDSYSLDLKTNKSDFASASAELRGFITDLNALPNPSSDTDTAAINTIKAFYEKWFDMDLFLKTYAINIACGMDDDYWGNANNYYLYFDTGSAKATNKLYFIPFDYDNTLGASINGDKEGFKHNPLEWGRGKDRPLIDKLLKVPAYKQKFVEYLLEVTSNEYWDSARCAKVFQDWGAMCGPYMNSPDLDYHIGAKEFRDIVSWNPEGYSLFHEPNVFDATRDYFRYWLNGIPLPVVPNILSEGESANEPGLVINIDTSKIPAEAASRNFFIDGKQIADAGSEAIVKAGKWVFPFVESGKTYKVKVEYVDKNYISLYKSPELEVTAKSGLGEIYIANDVSYEIKNNILTFNEEPVLKYSNETIPLDFAGWGSYYYVLELNTTSWSYQSWNHLGKSCNGFRFSKNGIVKDANKNDDLMFYLYFRIVGEFMKDRNILQENYGEYRFNLYTYDDTSSRAFKLEEELISIDTSSTKEGLNLKVLSSAVPNNACMFRVALDDNGVIYTTDSNHIKDSSWNFPYVEKGKEYKLFAAFVDENRNFLYSIEDFFTPTSGLGELTKGNVSYSISNKKLSFAGDSFVKLDGKNFTGGSYKVKFSHNGWNNTVTLDESLEVDLTQALSGSGISDAELFNFQLIFEIENGNSEPYTLTILDENEFVGAESMLLLDEESTQPGLNIKILESAIPENAYAREFCINDVCVSLMDSGCVADSDGGVYTTEHIKDTSWYYPYVDAGKTYSVYVRYYTRTKNEDGEGIIDFVSSPKYNFKPSSGLGELTLPNMECKIENNKLKFSPLPIPMAGNEQVTPSYYSIEFCKFNDIEEGMPYETEFFASGDAKLEDLENGLSLGQYINRPITTEDNLSICLTWVQTTDAGYDYRYLIYYAYDFYENPLHLTSNLEPSDPSGD